MTRTTIATELKKRTDLIEQNEFRTKCAEIAQELGMSAKEWNENKALILLWFANKVISTAENTI